MAKSALASGVWRPPSASLVLRDVRRSAAQVGSDAEHLRAAAAWLARAQDAQPDGGISGRYFLASGWSSSYPETTGYIIPTLLALGDLSEDRSWHDRAERATAFLLGLQLPDGAFPGGEISENRNAQSVFNTGQILHGLLSMYEAEGGEALSDAIRRAMAWLCSVQAADGSFRSHTYLGIPATYHAHAACWLADAAVVLQDDAARRAVERHVRWCLDQFDHRARWLDRTGFTSADHAARRSVTHTLAYALFGVLHASQRLGIDDGASMVRNIALRAADLTIERGTLPGEIDASWEAVPGFSCLTGSVQMALVWQRLHEADPDPRLEIASNIAIEEVKAAQAMNSRDPGIRGGVPGSWPVWGPYIPFALPNWAAKFLIDALLLRNGRGQPGRLG